MRLFIAGSGTETDTFVPFPIGEAGFAKSLALERPDLRRQRRAARSVR